MRFRCHVDHIQGTAQDMFTWCQQRFGEPGGKAGTWSVKHGTWHFRRREDYVMFTLRWI